MDRSDATVAAALAEVEKALGVEPSPPPAAPPAAAGRPPPGGVPTKPDGSPDYAQMEATGRRRGVRRLCPPDRPTRAAPRLRR